jgi:concanavalin A-like lectin/glucanase superfamily protein
MKIQASSTRRHFLSAAAMPLAAMVGERAGAATSSYSEAVLKKHPVAYWRLGEKHGPEAADASGNGHSGKYIGHPVFGGPGAIVGDANTAIGIAPPGSYVEIPSAPQFSVQSSGRGLSVEVWMRPDALAYAGETEDPYVMWLGKGEKGEMEWGFRFYSQKSTRPNRISAYVWNADGKLGSGAYFQDELRVGEWIHIVATFDAFTESNPAAGVSIYKNGVLRGSPATSKGAFYSTYNVRPTEGGAPVRLGTRDLGSFLTGGLDEVAIYPRKLTPAEVREHSR